MSCQQQSCISNSQDTGRALLYAHMLHDKDLSTGTACCRTRPDKWCISTEQVRWVQILALIGRSIPNSMSCTELGADVDTVLSSKLAIPASTPQHCTAVCMVSQSCRRHLQACLPDHHICDAHPPARTANPYCPAQAHAKNIPLSFGDARC